MRQQLQHGETRGGHAHPSEGQRRKRGGVFDPHAKIRIPRNELSDLPRDLDPFERDYPWLGCE